MTNQNEEDLAKKEEVDLLVERVQDPSAEIQKSALDILLAEIKSSTSYVFSCVIHLLFCTHSEFIRSMTSVPVTLKFLRQHYPALKEFYGKSEAHTENKVSSEADGLRWLLTEVLLANPC